MNALYKQKGFTLAEMMVVVLILAILATIAYPSYEQFVRQTRVENVRADLIHNAQQLERFYVQKKSFAGFADLKNDNRFFTIAFEAGSPSDDHFTLHAVPRSDTNANETRVLKIDDSNILRVCESAATDADCEIQ